MPAQIIVVGAGIAGLAAAVALRAADHEVTVLEQRTDLSSGMGISIWPNALAGRRAAG
jgi:2-polyprenyl-6-methoxyphenol hydroxylase-like FAD-dependent oxidoreductase